MTWSLEEPRAGDMIRVKLGALYHVGIYVSDEEVIQFGLPPTLRPDQRNEDIRVLSSDIDTFLAGGFLEVARFDKKEAKKNRPPRDVIAAARARIGEGGYHILYNNCEHFANECLSGTHLCRQAEDVRALFRNMPIQDVYLCPMPAEDVPLPSLPPLRAAEVAAASHPRVAREKAFVWRLLEYAVTRSFGKKLSDLSPRKTPSGKWVAEGIWFSLSHTEGLLAVAVSRAPIGIDAERVRDTLPDALCRRALSPEEYAALAALPEEERCASFAALWTVKEAAFKMEGGEEFFPARVCTDLPHKTDEWEGCVWSVTTPHPERVRVYYLTADKL
jgi:hypothetical protein